MADLKVPVTSRDHSRGPAAQLLIDLRLPVHGLGIADPEQLSFEIM